MSEAVGRMAWVEEVGTRFEVWAWRQINLFRSVIDMSDFGVLSSTCAAVAVVDETG